MKHLFKVILENFREDPIGTIVDFAVIAFLMCFFYYFVWQ